MLAIDREELERILADLVRIDSVNPSLASDGAGEAEIADYVAGAFENAGLRVERHEPEPGRISVVGILPGRGGGKSLMLNGHYDTVGVEGMAAPFDPVIRDGRLYGRGSYDMKGGVAAAMAAAFALARSGERLAGDVLVAAVADEEYASLGTADLVGRYPVDGAIVTEPTQLQICRAHKGFIWLALETLGRAAHGSQPHLGIDANLRMGRFLAKLDDLGRQLQAGAQHPLVGPASLHAATLAGGSGISTYAASCRLEIERRTIPGEDSAQVIAAIQGLLDELQAEDPKLEARFKTLLVREPFEVAAEAEIVRDLEAACEEVLGEVPEHVGENPWMDSALLADAGVETVVIGPGGTGAHADEEWVDLESVYRLAGVLAATAQRYCGAPSRSQEA